MNIKYFIADPAGNITALVTDLCNENIKTVAQKIMARNKNVEQVGAVEFSGDGIKLRMSGDEFCGNATMSAAALYCLLTKKHGKVSVDVLVFGTQEPVNVSLDIKDGYYDCECLLQKPKEISDIEFTAVHKNYRFPLVSFEGISHIIADESLSEQAAQSVIKDIAKSLSVKALGIMIFNKEKSYMRPLVYVPAADTLFFENSCASGSCAVAAVYAGKKRITISQPGGDISAQYSDKITLSGKIKLSNCCSEEI